MKQATKKSSTTASKTAVAKTKTTPTIARKNSKSENQSEESEVQENTTGEPQSLLEKFFHDQLKDIYYAENKLLEALPTMEKAATTEELQEAFNYHLRQTQKQVKQLDKAFKLLGQKPAGKKCEAIEGLIKEAGNIIGETKEGTMTRDAALIMAAQKIEHYEIATYGGLVQLAITVGQHKVADILDEILMEEEDTDRALTQIAENHINIEAEEEDLFTSKKGSKQKKSKAMEMA